MNRVLTGYCPLHGRRRYHVDDGMVHAGEECWYVDEWGEICRESLRWEIR